MDLENDKHNKLGKQSNKFMSNSRYRNLNMKNEKEGV